MTYTESKFVNHSFQATVIADSNVKFGSLPRIPLQAPVVCQAAFSAILLQSQEYSVSLLQSPKTRTFLAKIIDILGCHHRLRFLTGFTPDKLNLPLIVESTKSWWVLKNGESLNRKWWWFMKRISPTGGIGVRPHK